MQESVQRINNDVIKSETWYFVHVFEHVGPDPTSVNVSGSFCHELQQEQELAQVI